MTGAIGTRTVFLSFVEEICANSHGRTGAEYYERIHTYNTAPYGRQYCYKGEAGLQYNGGGARDGLAIEGIKNNSYDVKYRPLSRPGQLYVQTDVLFGLLAVIAAGRMADWRQPFLPSPQSLPIKS